MCWEALRLCQRKVDAALFPSLLATDLASFGSITIIGKERMSGESDSDTSQLMRQKFMSAEEVYLYKIPPLRGAGGHRAEDWNLAKPLQTCSLLVERRGDQLVLEFFTAENKLFAQSVVDCSTKEGSDEPPKRIQHWLEQVVDSSRYFTLRILGGQGREATIGFGFRDREQATDLRESMQHYETSMRREQEVASQSNNALQYHIPKLAEGEKIHIKTCKSDDKSSPTSVKKDSISSDGKKKPVPLLLKKPPPSPEPAAKSKPPAVNPKDIKEMRISLGDVDLDKDHEKEEQEDDDGSSAVAVYEGEDEDDEWDTEFQSA